MIVACSLGTLANGATTSVSLTATATAVGSITNTASVTENETNPTPANANASATITVTGAAACTGTIQWTGGAVPPDNQWTTPTNWSTGVLPTANDDVCIDTPFAGTTVTLSNSIQAVHSLVSAAKLVLSNTSSATSLTMAFNSSSDFLNGLTLNNATLSSAGSLPLGIDGLFTSTGTSSIVETGGNGVNANGGMAISGTLTVTGPGGNGFANFGPGTLSSGGIIQLSGNSALDNFSTLAINNASILTSSGSLVLNRPGATINVAGANVAIGLFDILGM